MKLDVDWEYPGGNGDDYKINPNSGKTDEITNYALLLKEIKTAIGDKELSIAVPGLERDMIAFTSEQVPLINAAVDVVQVRKSRTLCLQAGKTDRCTYIRTGHGL
jgi:chitinase